MNISFEYLYRDAANYKNWGRVIFMNPGGIDAAVLESRIRDALIDRAYFSASVISVPDLHFDKYDEQLDHGWHEFLTCTATNEMRNDERGRAIEQVVELLRSGRNRERMATVGRGSGDCGRCASGSRR